MEVTLFKKDVPDFFQSLKESISIVHYLNVCFYLEQSF
ncbi:hypothetical protein P278_15630 [Zhouia amylolytica AD3]|uniref:Uncharacterized protein n=1 Tax=Zhouia amylolytica AD3 TaxID=1286632 RepID=W2UQU2_9FLAO|nr:hypothetical protein P278_15630 [Zhouia amylolytica AD3]